MINPILTKGRVLLVRENCDYCEKWKKFIYYLNTQIKVSKRIKITDCTNFHNHGIPDDPLIKIFEPYFDSYPTLFFKGEKKVGISSSIEALSWLVTRLILEDDFIFSREPKFLETLNKYALFNLECRYHKGKLICREK